MSSEQLKAAQRIHDQLTLRYGDAIAKPRMATQLALGKMQITGSHLGAFGVMMHVASKQNCHGTTVIGGQSVPEAGCGADSMYADARWNPDQYFASRDAQWKATVTVGAITSGNDSATKPDVKTKDNSDEKH